MYCGNCGKKVDDYSAFCIYCDYILNFDKVSYDIKIAKLNKLTKQIDELLLKRSQLQDEIDFLNKETLVSSYNYSNYEALSSEQCRNELTILKTQEKNIIKEGRGVIDNNYKHSRTISNNIKQLLRCYNCECDNIFLSLNYKNIDNLRSKIAKTFESLNLIFSTDNISLSETLLRIKLEELNLIYSYEIAKQNEIELEKERRAQLLEEEKVRREIEKEKQRINKEESQFKNEVTKFNVLFE